MTASEHTELLPAIRQWHWDARTPGMVEHPHGAYVLVSDIQALLAARAAPDGAEPVPVAWQYRWREANWVPGTWSDWAFMTKDPTGSIQQHDYEVRPIFASPTGMGVTEEQVTAPEIANEIWEVLFNETKDCVPEELTDELLAKVAEALLSGYSLQRRARHG